eukprot:TRINITY_DN5394_c0_g3_i3.p1 TRINITY_DN5394_c0_g3~~TRINITY_DN5394_c0_g3_i3.p1  ORF type:complete len:309 (-),score=85.58 TRINITY_DN5394_c0_g3_i3:355-1281(-)
MPHTPHTPRTPHSSRSPAITRASSSFSRRPLTARSMADPETSSQAPALRRETSKATPLARRDPSVLLDTLNWKRKARQDPEETPSPEQKRPESPSKTPPPVDEPSTIEQISAIHGYLDQKNINRLLKKTNYNRRELYVIYSRYKALCALSRSPYGIDKETFKNGIARLAVEDDLFVDRVFDLVDEDGSGCIEWNEFLMAMAALEKGSRKTKAKFCFHVYDLDGDGYISKDDLATMFLSSSMLDRDQTTQDVVNAFVDRVFKTLSAEGRDKLSLKDITDYMLHQAGPNQDVWDLFGRSMLKDFNTRRGE